MSEEIVKVKRIDLENLLKANAKAYELLDGITSAATDVKNTVDKAFSELEDVEPDIESYIVEDDE